ncbi:MAG: hypothetical protein RIG63_05825 [Coleofasciculus chthonoplastes F3-SA18-01]|uniref:hypothetical protein n=1 Tax=Coleofasciculus chthonoplastes TaxID=64178 RepID=UPI0033004213
MAATTNKNENQSPPPNTPKQQSFDTPEDKYREALLNAATKAANLLGELMELSLIPDPRAKEAAEIALK